MKKLLIASLFLFGAWDCDKKDAAQPNSLQQAITVVKSETQCAEPWGMTDETNVKKYLKELGITKVENYKRTQVNSGMFCAACNCLSGYELSIDIENTDFDKAEKIGFKKK